jgi:hypothetical protein
VPRPKQYQCPAQRQAAYRKRQAKPATQAMLAQLAAAINYVVVAGADSPDNRLPAEIVGKDTVQTLCNLICWLDTEKDTVRHPNWDLFHPGPASQRGTAE